MKTVNKVILIGNVTRDPIIKTTQSWKNVSLFTIATNRHYTTSEGERKSQWEFHSCSAWRKTAEKIEKYLKKGKLVYVEGSLKTRVIEKENGEKLYKTEVVVSHLIFLNKKSEYENTESDDFDFDDLGE